MAKIPASRVLPKKESDAFKSIIKAYEGKSYKKGLRFADQVLKRFPEHGETLAMKGLILSCMGEKEEAHDLAKKGLRFDLSSHVCWHVFGLLHRSDRNYTEAVKCYLNALRNEPDNMQILKDLANLQVQIRDLKGNVETRLKLLKLKSNVKQHWMSYAVACDIAGNKDIAIDVINAFLKSNPNNGSPNYEDSELLLYQVRILKECERYEEALQFLEQIKPKVLDFVAWEEEKGALLLKMGRFAEAKEFYRKFLAQGTENYRTHKGLQCAVLEMSYEISDQISQSKEMKSRLPTDIFVLEPENFDALNEIYQSVLEDFPHSKAIKRIILGFSCGDDYKRLLKEYIKANLLKGVPSFGSDLALLFYVTDVGNNTKRTNLTTIEYRNLPAMKLVLEFIDECVDEQKNEFDMKNEAKNFNNVELWALILKCNLMIKQGMYEEALKFSQKAIEMSPETVEAYHCKARALKKLGAFSLAADAVDEGRKLDLSDRYMNNKTTKYMLRADRIADAEKIISLFTRHEGDPQYNLYEMQCSWYELEWAESHFRQKKYGMCLKKALAVEKHFADFVEDQVDFHTYCMRKVTLRAYIEMLRTQDYMHGNYFFRKAAELIVKSYLAVYDDPKSVVRNNSASEQENNIPPSQTKNKKKGGGKKGKQKDASKSQDETKAVKKMKNGQEVPSDNDPNGDELLNKNHLVEASRIVHLLSIQAEEYVGTWVLVFDVAIRKCKFLMALRALCKAKSIDPCDFRMLRRTAELFWKIELLSDDDKSLSEVASRVIAEEKNYLLNNKPLKEFVSSLREVKGFRKKVINLLEVMRAEKMVLKKDGASMVASSLDLIEECDDFNVKNCLEILPMLEKEFAGDKSVEAFEEMCKRKFPMANISSK